MRGAEKGEDVQPVEVIEEVGSTNAEMKARGRAGAPHGAALRACVQTAGRGQRSHAWCSPEGGLYLSILVRPEVPREALPALPVACALGALGALREVGCPRVRLKWPNDIVVGHRKLAGILTELATSEEGVFAVCGIGVNMAAPSLTSSSSSREGGSVSPLHPTGLLDELSVTAQAPCLDELAERIRARVLEAVAGWSDAYGQSGAYLGLPRLAARTSGVEPERWVEDPVRGGAEGPLAPLLAPYNASLAFIGEQVRVVAIDGEEVAQGMFLGVDGYGHALISQPDAAVGTFDATDVSIRPLPGLGA